MKTTILPTSLLLAALFCGTAHAQGDHALRCNGKTDYVEASAYIATANNFTMEAWIYPTAPHEIDEVSREGYAGMSGERYVIYPTHGTAAWDAGHAGAGFSAGTNGISVYEHAQYYIPAVLAYEAPIEGWTHVAVVYRDGAPSLYVNGALVKSGEKSPMRYVHPGGGNSNEMQWTMGGIGGGPYGYFQGSIDNVRVWNKPLGTGEIAASMSGAVPGSANLVLDFDMNRSGEGRDLTVAGAGSLALHGTTVGTAMTPVFEPRQAPAPAGTEPEIASDVHRPAVQESDRQSSVTASAETTTGATLELSRPNPFSESTEISYAIPSDGPVTVAVFDGAGRQVATLVDAPQSAGRHTVRLDASMLGPNGVYHCRLIWNGKPVTGSVTLAR